MATPKRKGKLYCRHPSLKSIRISTIRNLSVGGGAAPDIPSYYVYANEVDRQKSADSLTHEDGSGKTYKSINWSNGQ